MKMTMDEKIILTQIKSILIVGKSNPVTEGWMGEPEELEKMIKLLEDITYGKTHKD